MLWSAVIQEKFLVVNLECFSSLHVAHKPTEEIWIEISIFHVFVHFLLVLISFFKLSISLPQRGYPEHLHWLWRRGLNLDISAVEVNASVERSSILHVELVVLKLQYLVFVNIIVRMLLQVGLNGGFKNGCARVV